MLRSYLLTILAPYRRLKYKEEDNKAAAFTLELSWSSNTSQSKKNLFLLHQPEVQFIHALPAF